MPYAASRELEHVLFTYYCQTEALPFPNLTQEPEAKKVLFQKLTKLCPFQVMGCRMAFGLLFQARENRKLTILPLGLGVWGKMNQKTDIIKYL